MSAKKKIEPIASEAGPDPDPRGVLATIRGIQAGTIQSISLWAADRQACVEHLTADGLSIVEIAEVLKVSERTIARDRKAIRAANAVERDPKLVGQFVGQLVREAELAILRMRRASRDKSVAAAVKIDAEHRAWQVISDLTVRLQSLGYLPTAAQQVNADLTHHLTSGPPETAELEQELARLDAIRQAHLPADWETGRKLDEARQIVLRLSAAGQLQELSTQLEKEVRDDNTE